MRTPVLSCATFAALMCAVFSLSCNLYLDFSEPSLQSILLRDHGFLSRRGAHTYIGVAGVPDNGAADGAGGGNALFAREYSDLMSFFGQYKPVLAPMIWPAAKYNCTVWYRSWDGASLSQGLSCDPGGLVMTAVYIDKDDVAVSIDVLSSWADDSLELGGCAVDNDDGLMASTVAVDSGKVVIDQDETLYSFWGVQARDIRRTYVRVVPGTVSGPDVNRLCWTAAVAPADDTVVNFSMRSAWGGDASFGNLAGPRAAVGKPAFDLARGSIGEEIGDWFDGAPLRDSEDASAVMAWFLLWENAADAWGTRWTHETVVPSKRHYFRGAWLWDSAFIALALARGNAEARELGREQVRLFVDNQADDGRLPREIWAHDAGTGFQPPAVMTWAALDLAKAEGDYAFLSEAYDPLVAYHRWIVDSTDSDGDGRCEWSKEDSGMDTSPRFDDGPVEGVDLQAWMALDARLLGLVAGYIGREEDVAGWQSEAAARALDIRTNFWDETDGMFYDLKIDDSAGDPFVRVASPVAFLPLFVGAATQEQAVAVGARLTDSAFYDAPFGLPTAAVASAEYDPDNYWRGPVWIVTNAFAVWGLERYSLLAEADELRATTLAMIAGSTTPWEYYDSQTGKGLGSPDFMWSGVFYLLLRASGIPMEYD